MYDYTITANVSKLFVILEKGNVALEPTYKRVEYASAVELKKTVFTLAQAIIDKGQFLSLVIDIEADKPTTYNGICQPILNNEWISFIKALYFRDMPASISFNGSPVNEGLLDGLDDDILRFYAEASAMRTLKENVTLINRLGLRAELRKRTIDEFKSYLEYVISESGYDVELSSPVNREGLNIYKFYDGSSLVEGIRRHTKVYESYAHTLNDLLLMVQQIQCYKQFGLEPERPKQREDMLKRMAVAGGIEFTTKCDIDELDMAVIEKFLDGAEDEFISQMNLSAQMRLG